MKKILVISLLTLILFGCAKDNTIDTSANERYTDLIDQLLAREDFKDSSEYFDIEADITSIDGGYRFYVTIDNAKVAMYEIEAIAIEKDVDYTNNMAANIGLFEDTDYSIIPGQVYSSKGFVKGINISGTTSNPTPTLYVCVIWHNIDLSITHREYFKLDLGQDVIEEVQEAQDDQVVDENNQEQIEDNNEQE